MNPFLASGWSMRSETMATTTSSGTSSPRSMMSLARSPTGVAALTAARSMSPVESWTIPCLSTSRCACVPFPAPGGPSRMSLMKCPQIESARGARASNPNIHDGADDDQERRDAATGRDGPVPTSSTTAAQLRPLDQAFVLVRQQVALDLGDRVHGHADHDEQRGAAEIERHRRVRDQDLGDEAHDGKIAGADDGDAR